MIWRIYIKELVDCFRDRRTLILTVFLPIIMMSGLTLFYEKLSSTGEGNEYTLAVPTSFGDVENKIFASFDNITIIKSANPEKTLEDGDALAALLLPEDFMNTIENGKTSTVTIIGDSFSQDSSLLMQLVSSAFSAFEKSIVSERLQSQGISEELMTPIKIEEKEMTEQNSSIHLLAMLIPLIFSLAIGVGATPAALDLFAGEKDKKTMEALLITPVKRSHLLLAKWLTISTLGAITGIITLVVVALQIYFFTENLKSGLSFGDNTISILIVTLCLTLVYSMLISAILMLTSIVGKSVKEAQNYSTPVLMVVIFPLMFLSSMGINEFTVTYFIIPIFNLFCLFKELLLGVFNIQHILLAFGSNIICVIIILIISRLLFLKDKWVLS